VPSTNAPKLLPNSEYSWISHFHAHTVKNLSSCNSSACCPSEPRIDVNDPWVSYAIYQMGSKRGKQVVKGPGHTHSEFLVPPQDLRAQRDIMHRTFVIVINDVAFLILALVSRLCHRLALTLVRGGLRA
jgi:hypothetical protein